jgi:RNA polymerase-binding transcription factor DksA
MDAAHARDLLVKERERLAALREEQPGTGGIGLSSDDATVGQGLNDQLGGDAATHISDREVAQSIAGHLEAELGEIEVALQRVEDGTYGRCEIGGEDIIDERLELLPATRWCTEHAEEGERRRGTQNRGTGGLSEGVERERRDA